MPTYKSLADLKRYSKDMKARAKAEEAARAEQAAKDARSREGAAFFKHAMAELGVERLEDKSRRVEHKRPPAPPTTRQRDIEKQKVLEDSLSEQYDPINFLESDDGMLFRRPNVSPDIPRKLFRGEWTVQAHIDLHGLFVDEAREAVANFCGNPAFAAFAVFASSMARATTPSAAKAFSRKWFAAGSSSATKSWLLSRRRPMTETLAPSLFC